MCDWVGTPLAFSCGACYYFNERLKLSVFREISGYWALKQ